MDKTQVIQLIDALLSPENEKRKQAEDTFKSFLKNNPVLCVQTLVAVVSSPADFSDTQRQMACVQLRIALINPHESVWDKIPVSTQQEIKNHLIVLLESESSTSNVVRRAIDSAVSGLATYLLSDLPPSAGNSGKIKRGEWTELFPALFKYAGHANAAVRQSAFSVFHQLADVVSEEVFDPYMGVVKTVLERGLADAYWCCSCSSSSNFIIFICYWS